MEARNYIEALLVQNSIQIQGKVAALDHFANEESNKNAVQIIQENQKLIMTNWILKTRIDDITAQPLMLPNGTVGKPYNGSVDFVKWGWNDITEFIIEGLENTGLNYDEASHIISGNPTVSGNLKCILKFNVVGERADSPLNEKVVTLIINPDPKSLWTNIPSDTNDFYWKEDNVEVSDNFLDKKIVVSSKRGRSHANVGSFRDDDFSYRKIGNTGWNVVAVSDGAGSAPSSRMGSKIACESVISFFEEYLTEDIVRQLDENLNLQQRSPDDANIKQTSKVVYEMMSKAAFEAHKSIADFATKVEKPLKDFHTTLIFALIKKLDSGYALLTFGVGDCPIAIIDKDLTSVKLMNWLDVGEFSGGTRFITMPEIFHSDKFSTRFGVRLIEDFSYLFLMTDGIYDPKFVVEANLEKIEHWNEFIKDLKQQSEEGNKIDFSYDNENIAKELAVWMDFWSPGNHDDRTLAIIF